jgi:hypothetical protein
MRPLFGLGCLLLALVGSARAQLPAAAEPTNAAEAVRKKADEDRRTNELYQQKVATLSPARQVWEKILQENLGEGFYLPHPQAGFREGAFDGVGFCRR